MVITILKLKLVKELPVILDMSKQCLTKTNTINIYDMMFRPDCVGFVVTRSFDWCVIPVTTFNYIMDSNKKNHLRKSVFIILIKSPIHCEPPFTYVFHIWFILESTSHTISYIEVNKQTKIQAVLITYIVCLNIAIRNCVCMCK